MEKNRYLKLMWAYLHFGGGGYFFSYHLFRHPKVTTLLALMSWLPSVRWDESKPFLKSTCACRKKRKKKTHGLSLPPVTIKPSLNVVYIVKTGPLWALATIRINTWSFQTQTSPLIVPVNVKLFWKGEKYTHHLILSEAGRKTFRLKIITICI